MVEDEPPSELDLTDEESVEPDFVITLEPHENGEVAPGLRDAFA